MLTIDQIAELAGADFDDIGGRVGLPAGQTKAAMASLLPMVLGGMRQNAGNADRIEALSNEVGTPSQARDTGNNILGQIFGSKEVSRNVAGRAAETTPGVSPDIMKMLLPIVAAMAGKALTRKMGGGVLGGLAGAALGGLVGGKTAQGGGFGALLGALDQDGDGNPLDDIMGMFGKR